MPKNAPIAVLVPALTALLGTLGPGPSRPGSGAAGVADHVITTGRSAALRYWTAERMLHALVPPARTREDTGRPGAASPDTEPPDAASPRTGSADATPPGAGAPGATSPGVTSPGTASPDVTSPDAEAPGPEAADVRAAHRGMPEAWTAKGAVRATTGKVFFTIDGNDYVCTAGTVTAANRDLVVTAGHCAYVAGSWAQNWIYVPGYDRGSRPYGVFTARHMFVPEEWRAKGTPDDDVAMVALDPIDGRHVADVVGAQDIAFDQPRGTLVYGFGYPAGGRYDGERLEYCSGRTRPDPHRITHDEGLRCDMTEGSSGGPWLARFDTGSGTGVVTSVNSFKYADEPDVMYGPYFGPAIRRVYDEARRA